MGCEYHSGKQTELTFTLLPACASSHSVSGSAPGGIINRHHSKPTGTPFRSCKSPPCAISWRNARHDSRYRFFRHLGRYLAVVPHVAGRADIIRGLRFPRRRFSASPFLWRRVPFFRPLVAGHHRICHLVAGDLGMAALASHSLFRVSGCCPFSTLLSSTGLVKMAGAGHFPRKWKFGK